MVWLVLAPRCSSSSRCWPSRAQAIPQDGVLGFWPAVDLAVAGVVSFAPLAADYSRHSRTRRAAFSGASLGYGLAAVAYYALGVLAVAHLGATDVITALVTLPAGAIALGILLVDEVDEAFANVYSTTMSVQNLVPNPRPPHRRGRDRGDRDPAGRLLRHSAVPVVPVPDRLGVRAAVRRGVGRLPAGQRSALGRESHLATARAPVVAWACGFVAYQLVYPGTVPVWSDFWYAVDATIGFTPPTWLGSSVAAIVVSAVLMVALGRISARFAKAVD